MVGMASYLRQMPLHLLRMEGMRSLLPRINASGHSDGEERIGDKKCRAAECSGRMGVAHEGLV